MRRHLQIVSEVVSFFLEEFSYETEKSDAINALFQNFISSPQRDTEKSF